MSTTVPASTPTSTRKQLRALQFNVWLDGSRVKGGIGLIANKIIESKADIVSLSKYPILNNTVVYRTRENCIVKSIIELEDDGIRLAVYSLHLEYRCYTCYLPRGYRSNSHSYPGWNMIRQQGDGNSYWDWFTSGVCSLWMDYATTPEPVVDPKVIHRDNMESKRPHAIEQLLQDTKSLDIPIIIMGDFNEPSTLDWTEATAHTADHNGLVYPWDSTQLLKQHNFVDSYREIYPNPLTHPGYTWPTAAQGMNTTHPKKTGWIKKADERDRIDFIFYRKNNIKSSGISNNLQARDAWLMGTPISIVKDTIVDESDSSLDSSSSADAAQDKWSQQPNTPWPSDHRAVLTVFEIQHT